MKQQLSSCLWSPGNTCLWRSMELVNKWTSSRDFKLEENGSLLSGCNSNGFRLCSIVEGMGLQLYLWTLERVCAQAAGKGRRALRKSCLLRALHPSLGSRSCSSRFGGVLPTIPSRDSGVSSGQSQTNTNPFLHLLGLSHSHTRPEGDCGRGFRPHHWKKRPTNAHRWHRCCSQSTLVSFYFSSPNAQCLHLIQWVTQSPSKEPCWCNPLLEGQPI